MTNEKSLRKNILKVYFQPQIYLIWTAKIDNAELY